MAKAKKSAKRSVPKSPKKPAPKKPAPKKTSLAKKALSKSPAAKKVAPKKPAAKKVAPKRPAAKKAAPSARDKSAGKRGSAKGLVGVPPLLIAEEVLSALGLNMTRIDGDIVRWDLEVPPEAHFELVAQMIDVEQVVVYLVFRERVPAEHMTAVLEMLARVNHGLLVGAYEIDVEEGFIRLKSALDFRGSRLDPHLMSNLISGVRDVSEVYDEALLAVMHGEASAKEAIAQVES